MNLSNKFGFEPLQDLNLPSEEKINKFGFEPIQKTEGFFLEKIPLLKEKIELGKTILKGTAEGLQKLGQMIGPSNPYDVKAGRQTPEKFTQELEKALPGEEETFIQKGMRRGLGQMPSAIAFPGSVFTNIPRSIVAGFLGESGKELGLSEWAQSALEITGYLGPDLAKQIISKGSNKQIIDAGRKVNLSDEQITPLIQSEFKQKWLSKLSPKRGSTERALESTKKGLDESYGFLQKGEKAAKEISERSEGKLINSLRNSLNEMPSGVRTKIKEDLDDLLANKITGRSLINFFVDVNHEIGSNSKQLSLLKDPIKKALKELSPELGEDFNMINKLYSNYFDIASKLKPNLASDIVSAAESLGILGGTLGFLTYGNYLPLSTFVGEKVARKLAQQMLINPRFQQIPSKMVNALNENKFNVVSELINEFGKEIKKYDPKKGEELENIKIEDIKKIFNQEKSPNQKIM